MPASARVQSISSVRKPSRTLLVTGIVPSGSEIWTQSASSCTTAVVHANARASSRRAATCGIISARTLGRDHSSVTCVRSGSRSGVTLVVTWRKFTGWKCKEQNEQPTMDINIALDYKLMDKNYKKKTIIDEIKSNILHLNAKSIL